MSVVFLSRGGRRICNAHARNRLATVACATLAAVLIAGAGSSEARASSQAGTVLPQTICAPETHSTSLLGVSKCPATRGFTKSFDYPYNFPVLDLRASTVLLDDTTAGIPKLHFDVSTAKPVVDVPPTRPVELTALVPPAAVDALVEEEAPLAPPVIVGIASTYNPLDPADKTAGTMETASGELYDIDGWTAAIRTDLRDRFGGVGYGRNYKPTFALVACDDKSVIVRINDVGPLRPGRVIDLNRRTMAYFDPTLQLGLVDGVSVTPLKGTDWKTGPVVEDIAPINLAGDFAL